MNFYQCYLRTIHKLSIQNRIQMCKSITLLFLLMTHLLMGSGVLQFRKTPVAAVEEEEEEGTPGKVLYPLVTRRAPHFEATAVVNQELVTLTLSQFAGKYVVLLFYALDFSSVCPAEVTEYSERQEEFRKQNAVVLACSVDSPYAHMTWLDMPGKASGLGNIKIPLLSDLTHKISMDYGVYMPALGHSLRAQFIIDAKGIVRQSTINDLCLSRSVDETLRLIKACRYADITGVASPPNAGKPVKKYAAKSKFIS